MEIIIPEIRARQLKGLCRSYVAWGEERISLRKVTRTVKTFLRKSYVPSGELERILAEVRSETVEDFSRREFYAERRERFNKLKGALPSA